jgi:hypothetical protein
MAGGGTSRRLLRVDDDARSELTRLDEQQPDIIERYRDEEVRKTGACRKWVTKKMTMETGSIRLETCVFP